MVEDIVACGWSSALAEVTNTCLCSPSTYKTKRWEHAKIVVFQVRGKALTAMASDSGCQDTYLFSCLLILDANKYGFSNLSAILWNSSGWSFHAVASCSILDYWSVSILFLRSMCAVETYNLFSMQKFHILQFIFNAKIPYFARSVIASVTFYTAHIINVSNGCDIITHNSGM